MVRILGFLVGLGFVGVAAWSLLWGVIAFSHDGLPHTVEHDFHQEPRDIEFSFAIGSADLLAWMDGNSRLVALPIDECNDPSALGKIDKLVAINTALRVDLSGQANAQMINGGWFSGVGGQVDFMRGASHSRGGRAILALPSTRTIKGADGESQVISTIVPHLGTDDVVTTSMHDIQYVVTEHGTAKLEGKSSLERARALIAVAHPRFRPELQKALDERLQRVADAARGKRSAPKS